MLKNDNDAVIVKSIIDLGHNLGLKVVAEGVEDKATADYLKTLGCDLLQGYYFSKPLSNDDFLNWLPKKQEKKVLQSSKISSNISTGSSLIEQN
jgi:EAL domain-containing protein (putative c-di-GMP-specific phosphodiesterase class I)